MASEWIPEVGKLIVRQMLGEYFNTLELAFRDDKSNARHMQGIAKSDGFNVSSYMGPWTECMESRWGLTDDRTSMVVLRPATDNDIRMCIKCWSDKSVSLGRWLNMVKKLSLAQEEKDRIQRLLAEI